jgi:hypothetical protein
VIANQRFVYAWTGGHEANAVGYGAPLDTVVTWTLSRVANGTQVRLVHSGFVRPRNDSALEVMGEGWRKVIGDLRNVAGADEGEEKMSGAYTGGCACGAIRYEIADDPMVQSDCQCRDCQRKSGTGHTATSWVGRCLGTRRWACSTPCWLDAAQA